PSHPRARQRLHARREREGSPLLHPGADHAQHGASEVTMAGVAPHRKRERGVALIIAVISIAILTAVATEVIYNSRVDMQMAANEGDEIGAYSMARSGAGMARLLLSFQKQLNNVKIPPGILQMLGPLIGAPQTPTQTTGPGGAAMPSPGLN